MEEKLEIRFASIRIGRNYIDNGMWTSNLTLEQCIDRCILRNQQARMDKYFTLSRLMRVQARFPGQTTVLNIYPPTKSLKA